MLKRIEFLTSGESHGKALLGIIEGIPANIEISEEYIKNHLERRQAGHGRGGRMKIENDYAEIISGVRNGITIGSPIGLMINNNDWENWQHKMSIEKNEKDIKKVTLPRPGHADLAGIQKFGFTDIRNVLERSSARETTMRVALGSVCRKVLEDIGIEIGSRVVQIHNIVDTSKISNFDSANSISNTADISAVRCLDKSCSKKMMAAIDLAKSNGDSVGGIFEIIATGLPYGIGSYTQWNKKLNSKLAAMVMSINAFKSIEFGTGIKQANEFGSDVHDEIKWSDNSYIRPTNNAGGIEGGMSNSQPIIIRASMKPIPTLTKPLQSTDIITHEEKLAHKERTDSCAVPAASIITESMVCITLLDSILEKFGGDSLEQLKNHIKISGKY